MEKTYYFGVDSAGCVVVRARKNARDKSCRIYLGTVRAHNIAQAYLFARDAITVMRYCKGTSELSH